MNKLNQYYCCILFSLSLFATNAQEATVYFDLDEFVLTDSAKTILNTMSQSFNFDENLVIHCHCDSSGSVEYNQVLSNNRANSVKTYLNQIGNYNFSNAEIKGFGKLKPTYDNKSEERYKNRRCDLFLEKDLLAILEDGSRDESTEINQLEDMELKEGVVISLPNFEFVGNQAVPMYYSMKTLEDLLEIMVHHPDLEIDLHGHVCCAHNKSLSVARAKTVYDYLVINGVDSSRVGYDGFSNTKPLVEETTRENEQRNRRVEVRIRLEPTKKNNQEVSPKTTLQIDLREFIWRKRQVILEGSSAYNLEVLANMIKKSSGYYYRIHVYEKNGNLTLNVKRKNYLYQKLKSLRCRGNQFKVIAQKDASPTGDDHLIIEIIKR